MKRLQNQSSIKGFEAAAAAFLSLFLFTGIAAASTTTFTQDSTVNLFDENDAVISFADEVTLSDVVLPGDGIEASEGDFKVSTDNNDLEVEISEYSPGAVLGDEAYSFTSDSGESMDEFTVGVDNDNYAVFESGEFHDYFLGVEDSLSFTSETNDLQDFSVREVDTEFSFGEGVNMVSFPSKVGTYDVDQVLSDHSDEINSVWAYVDGEWKSTALDPEHDSELEEVEGGHGYIVVGEDGADETVQVESVLEGDLDELGPSGVTLEQAEWNLVGHYEAYPQSLSEVGEEGLDDDRVSQVLERDGEGGFNSVQPDFETGDAYWVSVDESISYNPQFQ